MSFQLKRNLLITILLLVLVGIIGLLVSALVPLFTPPQPTPVLKTQSVVASDEHYIEKIDNFSVQGFDAKNQLRHLIEAQHYFSLENSPALLIAPKVRVFNEAGVEDYVLNAKRAYYANNAQIQFIGEVDIHSKTGISHTINTPMLVVDTTTYDLKATLPITYTDTRITADAQGMYMQPNGEKIELTGKTKIVQENGSQLLTKNIYIDRANGKQHYYSKHNTIYVTENGKVYAGGMDMDGHQALLRLWGNVKILPNSGSQIYTKDLTIDQSSGQDIYQTQHNIHYQSKVADIHAKGMRYEAHEQKIKLTGGVFGRYNTQ